MIFVKWSCGVKKFCTLENSQKGHFSKIKIKNQPNRYQGQNEIEIEIIATKPKSNRNLAGFLKRFWVIRWTFAILLRLSGSRATFKKLQK